ncbi:MAG TPA: GGDEF domain-containing protein [Solirubrobacteraceae bacterium]
MSLRVPAFRRPAIRPLPLVLGVLFAAATIAVAAVAVWGGNDRGHRLLEANDAMESQLLRQALLVERTPPGDVASFDRLSHGFDHALSRAVAVTQPGSRERALLRAQSDLVDRWRLAAIRALVAPREDRPRDAAARARLLDRFSQENATLHERAFLAQSASDRTWHRATLFAALGLAALVLAAGGLAALRSWRRYAARVVEDKRLLLEDRRRRAEQEEFGRALQGTRTQREAQRMLKRQLERGLPDSLATVLNSDSDDERLEAVTAVPPDSPLATTLLQAEPEDCLAVRFGQPNHRAPGASPLLACELCGTLDGAVTCVPSLVGGEVIGSVLVETPDPLDEDGRRRVTDAVAHAAPVLASMRNLKLAETRAATDALTGLANRRAAEETLKLMLASADRSVTCCAVALFDLDHFKKVNDVYGHEKGDHLLAAVGDIACKTVRASDFVARFGGEEFLLVLSNTDLDGALVACNKLRLAIANLRVPGISEGATASFGVAMFPGDAVSPEALLRGADRALYAAKSAGRNCVKALRTLDAADGDTVAPELSGDALPHDA